MIFERNKLILVTLLFLAITGLYILFDVKDTRDRNVILKYSAESSRDYSYETFLANNGSALESNRRRASHLTTSTDTVGGAATINSAYFNKKKGDAVSIPNNSDQNKGVSISSTKKTNDGGAGSSSSSSSTIAYSSSRRGSSLSGMITENRSTASLEGNSTANNKPMRVDEDPGEPPLPVGDGVWILILGVVFYTLKTKIKK